jgi:FtsH-binding integral membrane protein
MKFAGWRWLVKRLIVIFAVTFSLDALLNWSSFLLGSAALIPVFIWQSMPAPHAILSSFALGLLMDSTHPSIPLGFHAFFLLGEYLLLLVIGRHLQKGSRRQGFTIAIPFTGIHHLCLSLVVGCVDIWLLFPCLLLTAVLNGLLGQFLLRENKKNH